MKATSLAARIYKAGMVKFGRFVLSSGIISPYYIDMRLAPSYPDLFDEISEMIASTIMNHAQSFDKVAGVELAGIPIATIVAYKLRKPMLYVRKSKKEHGTGSRVEGVLTKGDKVIVVDDVLTTGGTLTSAVSALREEGASVKEAAVFVDRMQFGTMELEKIGVKVIKVYDIMSLFSELLQVGLIERQSLEEIRKYITEAVKGYNP